MIFLYFCHLHKFWNYTLLWLIYSKIFKFLYICISHVFAKLGKGEKGQKGGKNLHYKNCKVHRIEPGFCIQTGDIIKGNGTSGRSIYESGKMEDENFTVKHSEQGIVSMANSGPNTASSQFFFTMAEGPLPQLDGKHVAFGKVTSGRCSKDSNNSVNFHLGLEVLKDLEQYGNRLGAVSKKVIISDCGQL